jgi:hypothetical protein
MKTLVIVGCIGVIVSFAGCKSAGTAEQFTWTVDCPKQVDRGAEFLFTVKTADSAGADVKGVLYRYQILWPEGSSNPLRHKGASGESEKVRARMSAGTATVVFTCPNKDGLDTKVLETRFEVK